MGSQLKNQYIYKKKLGEGGFGSVYLVEKKSVNKDFVIKVQYGSKSYDIVRNEVEQLKKMSHPNVVSYYGSWVEKNKSYIIMEYACGGNLREILERRDRPFSEQSAMYFFSQIILGVHHIHKQKVLHRDLKPANIVLASNCIVKIADFGIAKNIAHDNAVTKIGTKIYMAPEVLSNQMYDYKADIWSTGIILYEMLTKKFPFSTRDHLMMMNQISRGIVRLLDSDKISCEIQNIVYSMLQRSPTNRPSASQLVLNSAVLSSIEKFYKTLEGHQKELIFGVISNNKKI